MHLKIADHIISVEGDNELRLLTSCRAFDPFVVSDVEEEWSVRFGCTHATFPSQAEILYDVEIEDTGNYCRFLYYDGRYGMEIYNRSNGHRQVSLSYLPGGRLVEASSCEDFSSLRFALWFAVCMLAVPSMVTFVHSSVVVYHGNAVLFLGESGTGKSTHSRLWLKNIDDVHLLNDDCPAIAFDAHTSRPVVYGSPWSGKTQCYRQERYDIAAIVRLSQSQTNAIRRLSVSQSIVALQPSLPPALFLSSYFDNYLYQILSDIISKVPLYHLQCLPDDDAAILCFNTIFPRQ
ncbi:MAG: hypothetical protein J6Y98_06245 [Bacteroidales bacterium]|nr:hypothetical protein [Bacteroidales bacterium]